jgi:hypothetical protein
MRERPQDVDPIAWRLNHSIVRGEIDNRTRDRVTGKLWLVGREFPILLTLAGNASRDIAGCLLTFENPTPRAEDSTALSPVQMGTTGDITASRKVRVLDISINEALDRIGKGEVVTEKTGNSVYLEWYSSSNGRVIVESTDYIIRISSHHWRLSAEEDTAQQAENQELEERWSERIAAEMDAIDIYDEDEDEWCMDEFEWEKQLKESDAMADRYSELLKRYIDDPNREVIVAREMGWSWLEDASDKGKADAEASTETEPPWLNESLLEFDDEEEYTPDPLTEGEDWIRTEDNQIAHPLTERATRVASALWQFSKAQGLLGDTADPDLHDMLFAAQTLGVKLAGALNSLAYRDAPDGGFIVACLKRSLQYFDNAIRASALVGEKALLEPERIAAFRSELFGIRQEILRLMTHYRQLQ